MWDLSFQSWPPLSTQVQKAVMAGTGSVLPTPTLRASLYILASLKLGDRLLTEEGSVSQVRNQFIGSP